MVWVVFEHSFIDLHVYMEQLGGELPRSHDKIRPDFLSVTLSGNNSNQIYHKHFWCWHHTFSTWETNEQTKQNPQYLNFLKFSDGFIAIL